MKSPIIDPRPDGDCLFHCASIAINENTSTELVKGLRKGVVEEFLKLSEADQLRIARGELQELTTDLNQWSSAARKAVLEKYLVHGDNEMDEQHMEYLPENYLSVYRYVTDYADCDVVAIRKAMDKPDVAPDHDLNALAESMSETPEWQRALREDGMQRAQCGECPRCVGELLRGEAAKATERRRLRHRCKERASIAVQSHQPALGQAMRDV